MHIDKTLLKPEIPRTIRFTTILFDWLKEVSEREDISFNQAVLECCKIVMDSELAEAKEKTEPQNEL